MSQAFRYPFPTSPNSPTQGKPGCWGSKYDNEARECKACAWNETCRAAVVQLNYNRQTAAQPQYQATTYANQFTPQQYASPTPFVVPQPQASPYRFNQVSPQAAQPQPQPTQFAPQGYKPPVPAGGPQVAPSQVGWYGAIPDPAFGTIHAVPPPFRPQFFGESFPERVAKNMFLAATEAILKEAVLGIRQVFLAPQPQPAVQHVVDVTKR